MTTIKVTCPECGDIDLTPSDLQVTVTATWATYTFVCCDCDASVSKPADAEVVDLLSSAGVMSMHIPSEALESRNGPSVSYDDVLDGALLLADDKRLTAELSNLTATVDLPSNRPRIRTGGRRRRRLRW